MLNNFEKLKLENRSTNKIDTTYENWNHADITTFKLCNGMFHPRTGQSFQNNMEERQKYIQNYAPELQDLDIKFTLKRTTTTDSEDKEKKLKAIRLME